nr:MAG TPA: hypothetical protein [Bacteriophage sp.]
MFYKIIFQNCDSIYHLTLMIRVLLITSSC